jgi:hypothetical protein
MKNITQEDRARALVEELLEKLGEGWRVEALYRHKYIADGRSVLAIEIEVVDK